MDKSPDVISSQELAEILARAEAATPEPWISYIEGRDHTSGDSFIMTGINNAYGDGIYLEGATVNDQDFIAHARQDIPKLVSEVKKLKQLLGIE
jgi:hypothetical protein